MLVVSALFLCVARIFQMRKFELVWALANKCITLTYLIHSGSILWSFYSVAPSSTGLICGALWRVGIHSLAWAGAYPSHPSLSCDDHWALGHQLPPGTALVWRPRDEEKEENESVWDLIRFCTCILISGIWGQFLFGNTDGQKQH